MAKDGKLYTMCLGMKIMTKRDKYEREQIKNTDRIGFLPIKQHVTE